MEFSATTTKDIRMRGREIAEQLSKQGSELIRPHHIATTEELETIAIVLAGSTQDTQDLMRAQIFATVVHSRRVEEQTDAVVEQWHRVHTQ